MGLIGSISSERSRIGTPTETRRRERTGVTDLGTSVQRGWGRLLHLRKEAASYGPARVRTCADDLSLFRLEHRPADDNWGCTSGAALLCQAVSRSPARFLLRKPESHWGRWRVGSISFACA